MMKLELRHLLYDTFMKFRIQVVVFGSPNMKCVVQCQSPFDVYTVGYSISSCKNAWVVELPWGGYEPELVKILANGIKSQDNKGGFLEELILGNNRIESIGASYFTLLPPHIIAKMKRLVVFGRKFDQHEFDLLADTIPLMPKLVLLFNPELIGSTVKFMQAVGQHKGIKDISVVNVAVMVYRPYQRPSNQQVVCKNVQLILTKIWLLSMQIY